MRTFYKIKTYKEIKSVTLKGEKFVKHSFLAFKLKQESEFGVGILVTKKFGNAVKRNFAKRRILAAITFLKPENKNILLVFVPKKNILTCDFDLILKELECLLD